MHKKGCGKMKKPMVLEIEARPLTKEEAKIAKKIKKHEGKIESLAKKLSRKMPKK